MDISNKVREDVTLITESGYLMLVKSFTDDTSGSGFNVVLILLLVFYEK